MLLRIAALVIVSFTVASAAHAFGQVDACKDPRGKWTLMGAGGCDPLDVQGKCDQDPASGQLSNCKTNNGL